MQILTAQYPSLYTRKFRVDYKDFNTVAARRKIIDLFTLPKANQVVQVAFHLETPFNGGAITDTLAGVFPNNNVPVVTASTGTFSQYRCFNAASERNGQLVNLVAIPSVTAPTNNSNWCNFSTPTIIQCSMQTQAGGFLNQLTQGSLLIWITTMRLS